MLQQIGLVFAVIMPLFNIPLIIRMIRRRSSEDISLWWATGVWGCVVLVLPSGLMSEDPVWRIFNIVNSVLFSCVFFTVMYFRIRHRLRPSGQRCSS